MAGAILPQERCDFYVYVIFRPDGVPCYVGKGCGGRWKKHIRKSHNKRLSRIFSDADRNLPIIKLRENLVENEALEIEIALIAAIGRGRHGPLVNMTDGGDGTSGYRHTAISRSKLREYFMGRKRDLSPDALARMGAANKGRSPTMEVRNKISISTKMRYTDPIEREKTRSATLAIVSRADHKNRMSAIMIARFSNPAERAKISLATTGLIKSAEHLAKISAAIADKWKDPEYRGKSAAYWSNPLNVARQSQVARNGWDNPDLRARVSALRTIMWSDPIKRSQASVANKEFWANNPDALAKRAAAISAGRRAGIARRSAATTQLKDI